MDNLIKVRVGGPSVHGPWVMYGQVMALEEWREEVSSHPRRASRRWQFE